MRRVAASVRRVARPRGRAKDGVVAVPTRRTVFERDGRQCTFVGADGVRCAERGFLEIDHKTAKARDPKSDTASVRVYCRAHNRMHADHDFGAGYIERRIDEARANQRAKARRVAGVEITATSGGDPSRRG